MAGQHYDPIVHVNSDGKESAVVPLSIGKVGSSEACADALVALAQAAFDAAEKKKRQRVVKKIKCTDCGAILDNASEFEKHCMDESIEHSEDFAFECEEVKIVMDADEHRASLKKGAYDLESPNTFTFYDIEASPFSPLFPSPISVDDVTFPTVEHFRQFRRFAKSNTGLAEQVLKAADATKLAFLVSGQERQQDPAWKGEDGNNKVVTTQGMRAKLDQHPKLREQLLQLRGKTIVCLSDDLWNGVSMRSGLPEGQNNIGKILMALRDAP